VWAVFALVINFDIWKVAVPRSTPANRVFFEDGTVASSFVIFFVPHESEIGNCRRHDDERRSNHDRGATRPKSAPPRIRRAGLIRLRSNITRTATAIDAVICKIGNYLPIRGGSRKLNANGRMLFANG
jgi:hypothetical protein